jgi:hypothetical protein
MPAVAALLVLLWSQGATAESPPQRLPSAVLIWPLVVAEGGGSITDTQIELVNLSSRQLLLGCIYVPSSSCSGFDFQVRLTPNQPISWLASHGVFNSTSAVPPFSGSGELKCFVEPGGDESVAAHNTIQGRAAVFGADGQTIGYSAVGFLRLVDGPLTNEISLDGQTYTQCPDEQHFVFIASDSDPPVAGAESELVIASCAEDLENLIAKPTVIQFQVFNEFEEQFSASTSVTCSARRLLRQISHIFTRATLGTETGHVVLRGVQQPVLALIVDRFLAAPGIPATAGNEPALRGGRSAEIRIP